jgi:hypothetical protein
MKYTATSFVFCSVLLSAVATASAKEWNGIVPLKSTRADVERLLGRGSSNSYRYGEEIVNIEYAQFPCGHQNPPGWPEAPPGWNVPRDTVVAIGVTFGMKTIAVASLSLDLSKFERVRGADDLPQDYYYNDKANGFAIEICDTGGPRGEIVRALLYLPTAKEEELFRCKQ